MASPVSSAQTAASSPLPETDYRVNGELVFEKPQYDQIPVRDRGAIRILKVHCASSDHDDVVCELIPGTILSYKECKEHKPKPLEFKPYDALSWCWGKGPQNGKINIRLDGVSYVKFVQPSLVSALRALRHRNCDRHIWADAICINQGYKPEKNRQVEMMADIYGRADCVRIWLGDLDKSAELAILFIKQQVLQLQHFDDLCRSSEFSEKWKALLELMQREWFSRRWVVQEVALAPKAIIHCGTAKLSWNKFAVAVELFVEAETATHRLSEIMKTDTKTNHVPRYFEYISQLGASLLVDATGKLFRDYDYIRRLQPQSKPAGSKPKTTPEMLIDPPPDTLDREPEDDEVVTPEVRAKLYKEEAEKRYEQNQKNLDAMAKAQPLLTLEYLVSNLSIFDVTNAHDSIYALLGISKDTTPTAATKKLLVTDHTQSVLEMFTEKKQYNVDYTADYIDICKEFIEFCVRQNAHRDPSRALDVICRPFAIEVDQKADELPFPSWVPRLSKASYGMDRGPGIDGLRMGRKNADSLVGLPNVTHRNYNAAETKKLDGKVFRFRKRTVPKPKVDEKPADAEEGQQAVISQSASSSTTQEGDTQEEITEASSSAKTKEFGEPRKPVERSKAGTAHPQSTSASSSATHAKDAAQKVMTPLSGPEKGHSTTIASPEVPINTNSVSATSQQASESTKRILNHFSLFVKGFVLDNVVELQNSSQSGSIPTAWAQFANWDMITTPPEHFWRTLVADRGSDGKNPPVYYARACQESFRKGNTTSGVVDTTGLIEHERNSVVAQFCRRVQAAIWNRALVKTKAARLGLVAANVKEGDLVCILYGCSVPVILRPLGPKKKDVMETEMKWELNFLANYVGERYHSRLERRETFRKKREQDKKIYKGWEKKKRKECDEDKDWSEKWPLVRAGLMRIHEFRIWVMKKKLSELGNARDREATEAAVQGYVNVMVPQIYDIANWATQSADTHDTIMDRLWVSSNEASFGEPFKLTEDQMKLWDLFREDKIWRDWLQDENEKYLNNEGFRVWSANIYKKPIGYSDDRGKADKEWNKPPAKEWKTEWAAENSWFLCLDSFRAWLRERGKFCGSAELLDDKQKWEADQKRDKNEPEVISFNTWMKKEGRENPDRHESITNEVRKIFEPWRTTWLSENPDATYLQTLQVEQSEWTRIETELKQKRNQEAVKRKEEAQKRDKERFLERWRSGWKPEVVNWKEFEIMLCYGRHWVKLIRKGKRDYLKEWAESSGVKQRQSIRTEYFLKKRGDWAVEYPNWSTFKDTAGTDPNDPNDLTNNISPDLKIHNGEHNTISDQPHEGPTQTASRPSQPLLEDSSSPNNSIAHGEYKQKVLHNSPVNAENEQNRQEKPSLKRSQTDFAADNMKLVLLQEIDELAENPFASKGDLDYWVAKKKNQLKPEWDATQARIENDLAIWLKDAPRIISKDGKFHLNYTRPSNFEKKLQKKRREKERLVIEKERRNVARNGGIDHAEYADEEDAEGLNEKKWGEISKGKIEEKGHEEGVREDIEKVAEKDQKNSEEIRTKKPVSALIGVTQRLTEEEKVKYNETIETNFTTKMSKYVEGGQCHYEMMGECYIYGMMDGEAMAYQNHRSIQTTVFEIR